MPWPAWWRILPSDEAMVTNWPSNRGSYLLMKNNHIEFQVQSYLRHQGRFSEARANSYLYITKAMDFDITAQLKN